MTSLMKIDGSLGEGGGQVLRIALSLSALCGIPVEISKIREGRSKPGLAAQHLKGVELVKEMCNARVSGAYLGSTHLEFWPGSLQNLNRELRADTHTAGCICLLAQIALPCALFCPSTSPITLILKGGTNVPLGPHIEYLTETFRLFLNKFGADFDFTVTKRGYYPKGGGEVHLRIKPVRNLNAVNLTDPGHPVSISGWSYVAGSVNINVANEMAKDAKNTIIEELNKHDIAVPPINIEAYREDRNMAVGNGSGINIVCHTSSGCIFGGSGLGSRDEVTPGVVAAHQILNPLLNNACVDEHMQDQIIILMALAKGTSRVQVGENKLTQHTTTALQIAKLMLHEKGFQYRLSKKENNVDSGTYILECDGCGLVNDHISQ